MLRDYQKSAYDKTVQLMQQGKHRVLIQSPCGTGKSYLFLEMVKRTLEKGLRVLVLVHRIELKEQHTKLFFENGLDIFNGVRTQMVITESNHLGEYPTPDLIIVDEAHLSMADTWQEVVNYYDTFTIGFTATPMRLDGRPLGDMFEELVISEPVNWFIDHKYLAPFDYYAPLSVDVSNLKKQRGDYSITDVEPLVMDRKIYSDVYSSWERFAKGKKTIAYCVSVEHSKQVCEAFRERGVSAAHLDGNTPPMERKQIMDDFRDGKITVLCNCMLIIEGVSIDDCECCLLLRPTDSLALYIQSSMRCMRYKPDKKAVIIDCVGNYARHGLPNEEHEWSLTARLPKRSQMNHKGELVIRQCPYCYKAFKTAPKCPYCGKEYPLTSREIEVQKEIELKKIESYERKKKRKEQGQASSYEDLVRLGFQRGYKNPQWWAKCVLNGRR